MTILMTVLCSERYKYSGLSLSSNICFTLKRIERDQTQYQVTIGSILSSSRRCA